jgi:glycosyltransferase involved in cell wall biosynthesis
MIKLSVILPVFNSAKTIDRAIRSILSQSLADFELLIFNDGSTDDTLEKISKHQDNRISVINSETNIGSLRARNELFELVNSDYVIFQDADDWSEISRFQMLYDFMVNNKDVGICGTNAKIFEKGKLVSITSKPLESEVIKNSFVHSIPIIFASAIVRRPVLDKVGILRDFFHDLGNYDYDWMYRISEHFECANLSSALYNIDRAPITNSTNIVNPYKVIGHKLVQFLAEERKINQRDSLDSNPEKIELFLNKAYEPYKADKSLYVYDRIVGLLSEKRYGFAIRFSFVAIRMNPIKTRNYRTLLYVIRQRLLNGKK